jgi:hypothetical protein
MIRVVNSVRHTCPLDALTRRHCYLPRCIRTANRPDCPRINLLGAIRVRLCAVLRGTHGYLVHFIGSELNQQ